MLSRNSLKDGTFLNAFKNIPGIECWSLEQIDASMYSVLARRPEGQPVWVFAYGSLIWNPLFHFDASCAATLNGWRRSFSMRLLAGRACLQQPGRMMSLVPGGLTKGLALRFAEDNLEQELRIVWRREMVSGSYVPEWAHVRLEDGRTVEAIIFSANPSCPLHDEDDRVETVVPLIASASGPLGSNRDYVLQLQHSLQQYGIEDAYIQQVAGRLALAG